MHRHGVWVSLIAFFVLSSTVFAKEWGSSPPLSSAENPYFSAKFEPLKGKHDFYNLFRLTVANKTDKDLELVWNETRYLKNGKDKGVFVYRGIGAANIKNPPPEVIKAGETLTRDICPSVLIAYRPLRDINAPLGEGGVFCGHVAAGKHGILITVRGDGGDIRERLAVKITEEKGR